MSAPTLDDVRALLQSHADTFNLVDGRDANGVLLSEYYRLALAALDDAERLREDKVRMDWLEDPRHCLAVTVDRSRWVAYREDGRLAYGDSPRHAIDAARREGA